MTAPHESAELNFPLGIKGRDIGGRTMRRTGWAIAQPIHESVEGAYGVV
jgi:hypothetical protein